MGHNKSFSRRKLLEGASGLAALHLARSPLYLLIESIITGAHQKAMADTFDIKPRKLLHILQQGAPPRWTFDLFLTPYSSTGFVTNPQLGTNFVNSGGKYEVAYNTILKKGLNLPTLWQFNVPAAGGGVRPMDPLLDNMLQLRGIEVKIPDHGAAQTLQFVPLGAAQSLTALTADKSNAPIPGINLSLSEYQFKSLFAKSAVTVSNGGNMLSKLLSPFVRNNPSTFEVNRGIASTALDAAVLALNQSSTAFNSGSNVISNAHKSASDLLSTGFGNLTTVWNDLYNKYLDLVARSFDTSQVLTGINDHPIAPDGTGTFNINGTAVTNPDIRSLITSSTRVSLLAEHFAVAEYVLLNNLSDSISIGPGALNNVMVNGSPLGLYADEHTTGGHISLITHSYMNIAISACLLELMDRLKAKSVFNETVIVMGGEFGRSARLDAAGSDHGYMGSSSCIYSGCLNGPMILGNIYNNKSQNPTDGGTWGMGAPVAELGRALNVSDWTSTIAHLLRVPSPVTSASSLLFTDMSNNYISLIEKAKQV